MTTGENNVTSHKARRVNLFYSHIGKAVIDKINADFDYSANHPELYTVSEAADQALLRELNSIARKNNRKKQYTKISGRIALIAFCIVGVVAFSSMQSEAFKVRLFELLKINQTGEYISLQTTETAMHAESIKQLLDGWQEFYYPNYLPDSVVYTSHFGGLASKEIVFENEAGQYIEFSQSSAEGAEVYLDNSDIIYAEIIHNGNKLFIAEFDGYCAVYWQENNVIFEVVTDLSIESIYDFIDNIIYVS